MIRNRAARRWGHRYVMGAVNAYCPVCSDKRSREREKSGQSRFATVLTCDYDDET